VDGPQKFLQNHQRQGWRFYLNFLFQPNRTKNEEMRTKIKNASFVPFMARYFSLVAKSTCRPMLVKSFVALKSLKKAVIITE
jgi:hypothetical protein